MGGVCARVLVCVCTCATLRLYSAYTMRVYRSCYTPPLQRVRDRNRRAKRVAKGLCAANVYNNNDNVLYRALAYYITYKCVIYNMYIYA